MVTQVVAMTLSLVLVVVVVCVVLVSVSWIVYWLGWAVRFPIEDSTGGIVGSTVTSAERTCSRNGNTFIKMKINKTF